YVILSVFTDIAKLTDEDHYTAWKSFLQIATTFSVVYMVVMAFVINRQRKALEREKLKTKLEESQKKEAISLKDQLEVQVAERTAELTKQKEELQQALVELKSTQAQLIHSEKMASLGELTAGIAHEIQNPLNFVNNFSEVSNELIEEMNRELDKGEIDEARAIASDIKQNLEKINHHGKRADSIVKGMLQHSRISSGQKELTDINALCDEYLRLSYHGLRAKDKTFNAKFESDFDPNIGKTNIIPQDIGRVILNMINNAFYAVTEKKKQNIDGYEPAVIVGTKKLNNKIAITITDNGNGIPEQFKEKIFQPFFTTKPTGQGTGLGLSLSYDIIKAHGGNIKVDSTEGEGTSFIIEL
ncbi:MAG: GHKL domain-containing protein, partial [Bacteroidetes bacterium]|nr:GHKL domain-containing protein [Bacteroidota bacterium]